MPLHEVTTKEPIQTMTKSNGETEQTPEFRSRIGKISLPAFGAHSLLSQANVASPIASYAREGWQQLIIIGNGFDLECGLKSKYSDFFNPRRAKVYPSADELGAEEKTWCDHIRENGITVWDVILEEYSEYLWNDIERAIATWVTPGIDANTVTHFQRLLSLLNPDIESDIPQQERRQFPWRNYAGKMQEQIEEIPVARFILQTNKQARKTWDQEGLYSYLYKQLRLLEDEFKAYLKAQLNHNDNYRQNSWNLVHDLVLPDYPSKENKELLSTVLNFNYTNPIPTKSLSLPLRAINVHGNLDDEIVFGIDGKDLLDNSFVAPFTKTYRLLGLHSSKRVTLFECVGNLIGIGSPLDVIKFYGHSLSAPDYSYFQAIFDEVNLYAGSTRLVFYYRQHPGTKDARAEMSKAVSRLLAEYGRTMDNVDHGKNLMHKLILEGRLSVVELEERRVSE